MSATGVPPQIDLTKEIERLKEENMKLKELLKNQHDEVMEQLSMKVVFKITGNIRIEGMQPLTRSDLETCNRTMMQDIGSGSFSIRNSEINSNILDDLPTTNPYRSWDWGGKLGRPVPRDWIMPKCNVKAICDMFRNGIAEEGIRPFRKFHNNSLRRPDQQFYSKAEVVFNKIKSNAILNEQFSDVVNEETFNNLDHSIWDEIFTLIFTKLIEEVSKKRKRKISRVGELSYVTFYDMLTEIEANRR